MFGQTTLENMSTEGEIMSDNVREHQYRRSNNVRDKPKVIKVLMFSNVV
jgi:hypothetical protein